MSNTPEDHKLKINQLESKILDQEISRMVIAYGIEVLKGIPTGKVPDPDACARKIVARCREHLIR